MTNDPRSSRCQSLLLAKRSHESQIDNAVAFGATEQPALAPMENHSHARAETKTGQLPLPPAHLLVASDGSVAKPK